MSNNLDLYVRIAADASRYNAAIGAAGRQTQQFSELARAQMSALKGVLAEVGMQVGAVAFAMNGVKQAATMETALNDVASNIKKSTTSAGELAAQLREVRQTAIDVSKVTPFAAKDIVRIQDSLLKAGLDQQAIKGREGAAMAAAQLSALTNLDPTMVGDSLARAGSMFQLKSDAYDDAAESLIRGEAASPGKLQEILQSQKMFGTTANMLGVNYDDSVALAAMMTPLGDSAGSSLNNFLLNTTGNTKAAREAMVKAGLGKGEGDNFKSAYFENGKFIGPERATELTRKMLGKIKDDTKRMDIARDIFGEVGMNAAMQMVQATTDKTFRGIKSNMAEAIGREEKMAIKMQGFEMAVKSAAGTMQTSFALAFEPFLDDLAKAAQGVNEIGSELNKLLSGNPEAVAADSVFKPLAWMMDSKENGGLAMTGGEVGIAALVTGGLMSALPIARLLKDGKFGGLAGKGKDMIGGAAGSAAALAGNLATGKVLQEVAGVTPVYVVNMPNGGPGGGGNGLPDIPDIPGKRKPIPDGPRDLGRVGNGLAKAGDMVIKAGTVAGQILPWIARAAPSLAISAVALELAKMVGLPEVDEKQGRKDVKAGDWLQASMHLPAGAFLAAMWDKEFGDLPRPAANPKPPAPVVAASKPPAPVVTAPKPPVPVVAASKPPAPVVTAPKPPVPVVANPKPPVPVTATRPITPPVPAVKPVQAASGPRPAASPAPAPRPATPAKAAPVPAPIDKQQANQYDVSASMQRVLNLFSSQDSQRMAALTQKLASTDIGGTLNIQVTAAPQQTAVAVQAKPNHPGLKYNVGRTMEGTR